MTYYLLYILAVSFVLLEFIYLINFLTSEGRYIHSDEEDDVGEIIDVIIFRVWFIKKM